MSYQFKTEVDSTDYYFNEYLKIKERIGTYKTKATIEWMAEDPEIRSWGIKSFDTIVNSVRCNIEFDISIDDLEDNEREKLLSPDKNDEIQKNIVNIENLDGVISGVFEFEVLQKDANLGSDSWKIIEDFGWTKSGNLSPDDCEIDFRSKTITIS